jgi:hypothetical protein
MSEMIDIMIQAMDGNAALVLVLVGLFLLNGWQTRHFDKRFSTIESRVARAETHLMDQSAILTDGGEEENDGG